MRGKRFRQNTLIIYYPIREKQRLGYLAVLRYRKGARHDE